MTTSLLAGALLCAWGPSAAARGVTVAVLPPDTTIADLARVDGLSLGVTSAGIDDVPPAQTYLDVGQGNRISSTLYDAPLPSPNRLLPFTDNHLRSVPGWGQILERADSAPADLRPGLLATTLEDANVPVRVERGIDAPALIAADTAGRVHWLRPRYLPCRRQLCKGVTLLEETLHNTRRLVGRLRSGDLLIALPAAQGERTLPVGVAGEGFRGDLTSGSTLTDGYVLSTDIGPTLLRHFGVAVPSEMDGEPISAEGEVDPDAVEDLAERMSVIPDRRAPVVILSLVAWIIAAALVGLARPGMRRSALAWLALAFAYMPLMLLAGAAIEPSGVAEGMLVGFGATALALGTLLLIGGWSALAIACAITVVAYAIDVVTGSELTRLSLLGPNPIFGARFYGIGNELEALIAVMVPVAVGAGLTAAAERQPISRNFEVAAFLVVGSLASAVFAVGRFGADVGAAIVLPVGAVVAAILVAEAAGSLSGRPVTKSRLSLIPGVIAAPLIALTALALIDLVSGGNSHLTRSVLDAGGVSDLADVAQRRLELSAHDFAQAAGNLLFWLVIAGVSLSLAKWRRIDAWLRPAPLARAGFIGACAAVAVGVLVNDSGATFLVLGSLALGATLAFAWAQARTDP